MKNQEMEPISVQKVNVELENVLKVEDFVIEELPSLPLALEQGDWSSW
ncbi:hypothetical protein PASE110613_16850 [Paenibacillus sediminis]|uniref:Paeninodin family lasso peptide n=1 Tax=Paenibacillus sediminis TaxID=664909 RepID=A0ABS4H7P6_9BACL|nr:hypothetical protein [Paenibacillus sediminis]MBP1938568.1 hypothetical protein [Paenibacillus sediminis]